MAILTGRNSRLFVFALSTVLFAGRLAAQEFGTPNTPKNQTVSADQLGELLDSVRELKAQVRELYGQLNEVTAAQAQSEAEAKRLRAELELATQRIKLLEVPAKPARSNAQDYDVGAAGPSGAPVVSVGVRGAAPDETIDQKLARLEENTELLDAKVADQYQTKVESGSKYRLRLSGIVLFNLYGNTGGVNNQDFPELAMASGGLLSDRAFGGSLRQSQIGVEGFGPDLAGARTSARVRFDFAGDTVADANGAVMGQIRLRTATFRMDWENTSLVAGQDTLFFVPLTPTSLASLAVPALSYSGNLWGWTPQVRVEHRIKLKDESEIHLAAGILDQITGDYAQSGQERIPSWGEQSGQPGFAAHVGWAKKTSAGTIGVGAGGYYGRQFWGFARYVDSWTGAVDLQLPITSYLEFAAAYYRGRAVGGFGGGIAQSVLLTGPFGLATSSVRGLDSEGGWAQITLKPLRDFKINGAFGQDDPFAWQVRAYPVVPSGYEEPLTKNQSWFVNGIYQFRSNILFSLEFRRFATHDLGPSGYFANNVSMSLGYLF